jgi:hypothetical protein
MNLTKSISNMLAPGVLERGGGFDLII